ncbi:MAG: tetratricopeptide repeat protein, partial [Prochloraceae cyanobacterium]
MSIYSDDFQQYHREDEEFENPHRLRPSKDLNPERDLNPQRDLNPNRPLDWTPDMEEKQSIPPARFTSIGGESLLMRAVLNHNNIQQASVEDLNPQLFFDETLSDRIAQPIEKPPIEIPVSPLQAEEKTKSSLNSSPAKEEADDNYLSDSKNAAPASEITSPTPQQPKQTGEKFYQQQDYQAAYPIFETCAKQQPEDLSIQFFLAVSATNLGKYNEAITATNKLIESRYKIGQAYYFQGIAYEKLGQKDLALNVYRKAASSNQIEAAHKAFMKLEQERVLSNLDRTVDNVTEITTQPDNTVANESIGSEKTASKKPRKGTQAEFNAYLRRKTISRQSQSQLNQSEEKDNVTINSPSREDNTSTSKKRRKGTQAEFNAYLRKKAAEQKASAKRDEQVKENKKFLDNTEFLRDRENLKISDKEQLIASSQLAPGVISTDNKNLPDIVLKPDLPFAVPGTTLTYYFNKGEDLAPNHFYQYRWEIHNDKAALERYRSSGFLNRLNFGAREVVEGPSAPSFEVTWDLVGKHTIICYRYTQGKLTNIYKYVQEVRDPVANAEKQFDEKAATALQPDVYLAQLELRKEILENADPQKNADKIEQLDEAIANAKEKLGVSEKEPLGNSYPLKAILVPKDIPDSNVPLQLYLRRVGSREQWEIVDLTNPAPDAARNYVGTPDPSRLPGDRQRDAIAKAWQNFLENTPNPAGQIVVQLPGELSQKVGFDGLQRWNGYSNGISGYQQVRQWLSRVGFGAGLGAI